MKFTPQHINATTDDFNGNDGIGRYIFLPGSDGRAKEIATSFDELTVKQHSRGHHLYLGSINHKGRKIAVAAISSGMGCASLEIIMHELFHLGAKRFLRVGTAGSIQQQLLKIGDFVNAQAAVRDEQTSHDYAPLGFPAIASYEFIEAIHLASQKILISPKRMVTGVVHCKSSFYAREFGFGPLATENSKYMNLLTRCGVLASEMETSSLFVLAQIYNQFLSEQSQNFNAKVLAGAVLGILAMPPHEFANQEQTKEMIDNLINLGIETIKTLSENESKFIEKKQAAELEKTHEIFEPVEVD